MNKVVRASAVLASSFLAVPLWGVPTAAADQTVLVASSGGYFNSDGIRKPDEAPAAPPNATSLAADGVAPEHLAVAARAGQENKVSFLLFDLFALDPAATISKAVLTVPVAPDGGGGNVNIAPAPEKVIACQAGPEGFGGDDGTSTVDAPARLCDQFSVPGVATADGSAYAFDVTALAQTWLTANDGVALTSAPAARGTAFQRVFKPAPEAKLALTFTAPPADPLLPTLPTDVPVSSGGGSTDLGGSFDTGSFSAPDAGVGATEPLISADVPLTAPADAGAEPAVAAPAVTTVPVGNAMESSLTPTPSFWVGLLLMAGVLALLSLILGDSRVVQGSSSRQSRLTQALQARQRGTTGGGVRSARPALL